MRLVKTFEQCRVLVVDDNAEQRHALSFVLSQHFIVAATDSAQDIDVFFKSDFVPDMVLIALDMSSDCGLAVCRTLRNRRGCSDVPIIIVTDNNSDACQERCWQAGATDFVVNPVPATLIHRSRNHLKNYLQLKTMEKLLMHDALTGVKNRNFMHEEATAMTDELAREERELGIILLDIDDFKKLNDTFGHEHGDRCLKAVAQAVSINCKRPGDTVIRFGGEEFLIMLPRTGEKGIRRLAEDIVKSVATIQLAYSDNVVSRVTVSVGATWRDSMKGQALDMMIHEADMAMYSAKRAGKNRYMLARPHCVGERKKYRCRPAIQSQFINCIEKNREILAKHTR